MARGQSQFGRGSRLRKVWSSFGLSDNVAITTTQIILGSVDIPIGGALEATVLRIRGEYLVMGVPNAANDSDVIGLGIIVVRNEAFDAGGVSVPGPISQIGSDSWMWHSITPIDAMGLTAESAVSLTSNRRVIVDSKAMRKVPEGSTVILVGQASTGDFSTVTVHGQARVLLGV